ncbi:MAG TPA: D-aminoacylase [bacterium]|nr:D-aminoacylase [bacterium]HPN34377.1 D-aminoacylase [bacterium]
MNRRRFIAKALTAAAAGSVAVGCERKEFDLLIVHGLVYDGLGNEPAVTDIGVRGNRIAAVGDLSRRSCHQRIDAAGMAVTPGFIDVHTHSDVALLANPNAESKIRQGVTTEICGNCGDSPYPLDEVRSRETIEALQRQYELEVNWRDLSGYFDRVEKNGVCLNVAVLVGHSSLREAVMGPDDRPPSEKEMGAMRAILREYLGMGALGLSTGLEYKPGMYAETGELIELCNEVAHQGAVYATHMRNEDLRVEEALDEALAIGAAAGCRVQISHFKACQKRNWHKTPRLLRAVDQARRNGLEVCCDRYPYTAYSTSLKLLFPIWSRAGGDEDLAARLSREQDWLKIRAFVQDKIEALGSWESVLITRVSNPERKECEGQTVARLAGDGDPYEYVRRLMIDAKGNVSMCGFAMSEEDTAAVLAYNHTMVGSDGDSLAPYGVLSRGMPHPRSYGSFPRYLGYYVREKKILPLTEAIRRITSLPCSHFSIADRGVVQEGMFADLVIFDPQTVIDQAAFTAPHQYPKGISHVVVNGRTVIHNARHSGEKAGRILRRA